MVREAEERRKIKLKMRLTNIMEFKKEVRYCERKVYFSVIYLLKCMLCSIFGNELTKGERL